MKVSCKNCLYWDHKNGRNQAGAAVYHARCLYSVNPASIPLPASARRRYNWGVVESILLNKDGTMMGPKDGEDCAVFDGEGMPPKAAL